MNNEPTKSNAQVAENEPEIDPQQLSKLLLETGPLAVFFVCNSYAVEIFGATEKTKIFWATGAFMVATTIALIASRILFKRLPIMPLVGGVFVLGFGAITLFLQDDFFIKIKPTVVNLMFASILFGGLLMGQALLKFLFGEVFKLEERGWQLLTFRWACFFVFLAILNEFIWRSFSTDFWAGFKLFGVMPITMIFAISQVGLLNKYQRRTGKGEQEEDAAT
ncbi:MAG: septation protein A [Hyphomicrobiaceae bacterium TMED74]|jgi:intracellular septation protein|nr:septation protein A [Filomicrobium sp.]RPG43824.1 MAG: septation protein A [Hyphomicrobiaceae bacterium TMED74]